MIPINQIQQKNEVYQQKASTSSGALLPAFAWRHTLKYLTPSNRNTCVLISQKLGIIVLSDPSAELERMRQRKSFVSRFSVGTKDDGPTYRFLYSPIEECNFRDEWVIKSILEEMRNDPNVNKAVLDICQVEASYPEHIPLPPQS